MPEKFADLCYQFSVATGLAGDFVFSGTRAGYRTFAQSFAIATGKPRYVVRNPQMTKWAVHDGVLPAADRVTRGTLVRSSTGADIDWQASDHPLHIYPFPSADVVDDLANMLPRAARPAWLTRGMWVGNGSGATGRIVYWYDGASDIAMYTLNETAHTLVPYGLPGDATESATGLVKLGSVAQVQTGTVPGGGQPPLVVTPAALAATRGQGDPMAPGGTITLTAYGRRFDVTGTPANIDFIAEVAGSERPLGSEILLHTVGVCTFKHHVDRLLLYGAADFVSEAGAELRFVKLAALKWKMAGVYRPAAPGAAITHFQSGAQTWAVATSYALAHGLGGVPRNVQVRAKVKVGQTDQGRGATDPELVFGGGYTGDSSSFGIQVEATATDVIVRIGAGGPNILNLGTLNAGVMDVAKYDWVVEASR